MINLIIMASKVTLWLFKIGKFSFIFSVTLLAGVIAEQELTDGEILKLIWNSTPSIILTIFGTTWIAIKAAAALSDFLHHYRDNIEKTKRSKIETEIKRLELEEKKRQGNE